MEIKRLSPGQAAPATGDCISIDAKPGGGVVLSGVVLCNGDSVALTGIALASPEEAEEQGLAWAAAQDVELLYVTYDAPSPGDLA